MDLVCGQQRRPGRAGPGPAAAAMWLRVEPRLPPSQSNTHHTKTLRWLTWEDEKERQMFRALLISRVCFSPSCAAFGSVWSGVDNPLLSHPLLSLPQRFDYVRNAAPPSPPNTLFYFFAAPPGLAVRRGVAQIFQIFLSFPAVQIWPVPAAPID